MATKESTPEPQPHLISQAECARQFGIDPAVMTRKWKKAFEERELPGFYAKGVNIVEFAKGYADIRDAETKAAANRQAARDTAGGNGDPDDDLKRARRDKLTLEIQALRDEMIYVPDLKDEIVSMAVGFVQAQRMIPRTLTAVMLAWMAELWEDDLKDSEEVQAAFRKISPSILERFLDDRLDGTLPDLGKGIDKAFRNSITRARIRFG